MIPSISATWVDFTVALAVSTDSVGSANFPTNYAGIRALGEVSAMAHNDGRFWKGHMELVFGLNASDLSRANPGRIMIGFLPQGGASFLGGVQIGIKITNVVVTYD
jgi:hypothetical protein